MIALLFQYGASVESPEGCELPILHLSVMCLDTSIMGSALKQIQTPRLRDTDGRTPLHLAAATGQQDMIRVLTAHGFKMNDLDSYGCNILLTAIKNQQPDIVTFLSDSDDSNNFESLVTEPDAKGITALQYAILADCTKQMIDGLLRNGADPRVTDMKEETRFTMFSWMVLIGTPSDQKATSNRLGNIEPMASTPKSE